MRDFNLYIQHVGKHDNIKFVQMIGLSERVEL